MKTYSDPTKSASLSGAVAFLLGIGISLPASQAFAFEQSFTLDGQFDLGVYNGLNHNVPAHDQLQLNATGTTFPVLWVANAGEDTLSRIDTDKPSAQIPSGGCETARYRTWFNTGVHGAWDGPAPSRTAVDIQGNVYVANRQFPFNRPMEVMKILAEGGIDRNGNGKIDTSTDLNGDCQIQANEIMPLVDSNSNNIVDPNEIQDERIAWIVRIDPVNNPNSLGRSLCIGTDGNIWVGDYNGQKYYKISSVDGALMAGPINVGVTPYGCLVDRDGMLWSANLGSTLGVINTNTNTGLTPKQHGGFGSNYGIAVGNGKVYLGGSSRVIQYDPGTNVFSYLNAVNNYTLGISVDGNGDIVQGQSTIYKFHPDGSVVWSSTNTGFPDTRGVVPDQNNDIWAVNRDQNNVRKFRGTDGALLGTLPVGSNPYTYSDATGFAARNVTTPSGFWNAVSNSGAAGTQWDKVTWNAEAQGNVPAGAVLKVEVRAADSEANLPLQPFVVATNGGALAGIAGQYLGIRVTMEPNANGDSPILSDLKVASVGGAAKCDIDKDGDIDKNDISAIFAARGQKATADDPRDLDNDGLITVNDSRGCVLKCTRTNCAIQ